VNGELSEQGWERKGEEREREGREEVIWNHLVPWW
jgi:hypothetical protein